MSRAMLVLDTEFQRRKAIDWIRSAKAGTRVEFKQAKRTADQSAKMWAMLTEVASQARHHGIKLAADDWKLLFLDALKREVRMIPNLDGNGIVSLGRSSSDLSKQEMSDLLELIYEYGARNGVAFHNPHEPSSIPEGDEAAGSSSPQVDPAADQSAGSSSQEGGRTGEDAVTPAEQVRASSPAVDDEPAWLRGFARMMLAAVGVDEEFVVNTSKGAFVEGLSDDTRARAREITRIAREVCRREKTVEHGALLIAGHANCEIKEVA